MVTFDPAKLEPRAIRPNPGGQIDPGDHIGHGAQHEALTTALRGHGALLTGDRRMGKTSMLNVIQVTLKDAGHEVIRLSAETEHFETFAERLRKETRDQTVFGKELDNWSLDVDLEYAGISLTRVGKNKERDVDEFWAWAVKKAAPKRLYVLLDEITVLAYEMNRSAPGAGLELLRGLKRARDMTDGAIMVFAGSIGIHHALPDRTAINDLMAIAIGPLEPPDATFLARCLFLGGEIDVADELAVARAMVSESGGIAFYMHHIAASAAIKGEVLTEAGVAQIVTDAIENPDDPWQFGHYEERLNRYYGEQADKVGLILDDIATAQGDLALEAILARVRSRPDHVMTTHDELRDLLSQLERDHYLVRSGSGSVFASSLLQRAWLWIRRL